MKKLSKKHANELEALQTKLSDAALAFNEARSAVDSFREDRLAEMEEWAEERSERWHEGEAGEAHQSWRDAWDDEPCDEAPDDFTEYPTEMEL